MMDWISVEDKLPNKNTPVIVYFASGTTDYLIFSEWQLSEAPLIYCNDLVTHWFVPETPEDK